jgi:hypothetical protein
LTFTTNVEKASSEGNQDPQTREEDRRDLGGSIGK